MRNIVLLVIPVLLNGCQTITPAGASQAEVQAATESWVTALNICAADRLAALYDRTAVLMPSSADEIITSPEGIRQYYERLCKSAPGIRGALNEQHVRVHGDTAINSGRYTFTIVRDRRAIFLPSRFTFAYHKVNGQWLILDHHSSQVVARK